MNLNNITYIQIFEYYKFELKEHNSFCLVFNNFIYSFALYLDKDNDNLLTAYSISDFKHISKINLVKLLNKKHIINDILLPISEIKCEDLKLNESITFNNLQKYLYNLSNINPESLPLDINSSLFLGKQFSNIMIYDNKYLSFPLFKNEKIVNFLNYDNENSSLRFNKPNGFWHSVPLSENDKTIIFFEPADLFEFLKEHVYLNYQFILVSPVNSFYNSTALFKYISDHNLYNKPIYLSVNSDRLISLFRLFFDYLVFNNHNIFIDIFNSFLSVTFKVQDKKELLKTLQFLNDLSADIYKLLNIDSDKQENVDMINEMNFKIETIDKGDIKFLQLSFPVNEDLISLLINKLIKYLSLNEKIELFYREIYIDEKTLPTL